MKEIIRMKHIKGMRKGKIRNKYENDIFNNESNSVINCLSFVEGSLK